MIIYKDRFDPGGSAAPADARSAVGPPGPAWEGHRRYKLRAFSEGSASIYRFGLSKFRRLTRQRASSNFPALAKGLGSGDERDPPNGQLTMQNFHV
jgi:hypothetical protein